MVRIAVVFAILLGGCSQYHESSTPTSMANRDAAKPVEDAVSIEFSDTAYSYSVANAALGIEIDYEIVVRNDVANVLPLSQHSHSNVQIDLNSPATAQKCVLAPFARLTGNDQIYGEFLGGCLAAPITISPATLGQGRYPHTFTWAGRNLPNDGGGGALPYGVPFPAGEYVLSVRCTGKVVTQGVAEDFDITNDVALTLTN